MTGSTSSGKKEKSSGKTKGGTAGDAAARVLSAFVVAMATAVAKRPELAQALLGYAQDTGADAAATGVCWFWFIYLTIYGTKWIVTKGARHPNVAAAGFFFGNINMANRKID